MNEKLSQNQFWESTETLSEGKAFSFQNNQSKEKKKQSSKCSISS